MSKYQQVIELIRKGEVALFIGSGFSIKAGAPSGEDLCNTLYNALPKSARREKGIEKDWSLQNLSAAYETHYGREALIDTLKVAFDFERQDTSDQKRLADIPLFKQIITTNYDSLIEEAYTNNCNLVVTSSDLSQIDQHKPTIYKIHGDFSHPDNIIITKRDYNRLYAHRQENLIWDTIHSIFARHNILFIGYSLSDQNIQILIEYVKEQMGDSFQQLFVLVPSIEETAQLQIEDFGAEYIQGTAEDLFNELIPALKDHIVEDCRQRTTSPEDCDLFLREHDLLASFELGGLDAPNKLLTLRSISGKGIHHTLSFSMRGNGNENPLDQVQPYYDEKFDNLPVKKITDFNSFELRANDILISRGEDISAIYFYPIPSVGEICISIPRKQIIQKAACRYYDNGYNQLQVDADIDIGQFQIMIPISPNTKCGFNLKQNDNYKNNITAIVWANVFCAIFSGEEFTLTLTSKENVSRSFTYAFKKNELKRERREAKAMLQYYKYVQGIELLLGRCFSDYQKFTNASFDAAEMIYHYLKKEPIIVRHPKKGFEYEVRSSNITSRIEEKNKIAFVESYPNVNYQLNRMNIIVPYIQLIYHQSILKSVRKDADGNYTIRFIDKAKDHVVQLRDTPIRVRTKDGTFDL